MMEQKELRILKAITDHTNIAVDFCSQFGTKLFINQEARIAAKPIVDYVKSFKTKPTKRVLLDKYSSDEDTCNAINNLWEELDNIDEYDQSEYNYDLSELKKNYSATKIESLKNLNIDTTESIHHIESVINDIKTLNKTSTYTAKTLKDNLSDFAKQYAAKIANPDLGKGILTGYSYLDYIKNGLRPSDLIIIAGETGTGKSIFLNNIALNIWKQNNNIDMNPDEYKPGYNIVYFSLEMPFDDCFQRSIAALADVPSYGIRDAKLSSVEAKAVKKACDFIKKYPYQFDIVDVPRGLKIQDIEHHIERIKRNYTPDVIFVDYLSLMEDVSDAEDWLKLGELTGKLHELARTYNIPIVTAVQLNRLSANFKDDPAKKIGLHRIGRSALIATHATLIIQIEDVRMNEQQMRDFKYYILKNRHGESGGHASIGKNFAHCIIKDRAYDTTIQNQYTQSEDISEDIGDIFAELENE
jgi:replicative DNA helicase